MLFMPVKGLRGGLVMNSLRKAIDTKCRECIYDDKSTGTWLKQVEECTAIGCPLYPVRPQTRQAKLAQNGKKEQPEHLRKHKEGEM